VAPWETAVQLAQQQTSLQLHPHHLSDVYLGPKHNQLNLIFTAETAQSPPQENRTIAWFAPHSESDSQHPQHQQMAINGTTKIQPTQFHRLSVDTNRS
jgi:hypothetical protein